MSQSVVPSTSTLVSSSEDTVINGNAVTTTTETTTINPVDDSITTTTTVDKTDHSANGDSHSVMITQTTTSITTTEEGEEPELEQEPLSELDKKIIRQVEYYFGDANLVKDKFLKMETAKDEGWVPISVLTTFKRLASMSTDPSVIMGALARSTTGLLELDDTNNKIRRVPARSTPNTIREVEAAARNRTVFVKGFPKPPPKKISSPAATENGKTTNGTTAAGEALSSQAAATTESAASSSSSSSSAENGGVTLDDLLKFFEKCGTTDNIVMHRAPATREFTGNVFVTFPSDAEAKAFIDLCKTGTVKYNDTNVLEATSQTDFYKKRALEDVRGANANKGGKDPSQQQQQQQQSKGGKNNNNAQAAAAAEHLEKLSNEVVPGVIVHLSGMPNDGTREMVKEKFSPFSANPWIEYSKGDSEAWVRLSEANTAKDVLEKVLAAGGTGQLMISKATVTARVLEGDEEATFWKENNQKRANARAQKGGRGNRGGGGGGRGGGGKFRGNNRGGGGDRGQKRKRNNDQEDNGPKSTAAEPKEKKPKAAASASAE